MIAPLRLPQRAAAIFIIIAAVFIVYWPAQRNGFVWDDHALVLRDPLIRSWRLIPESFQHFLFIDATASNFYRPIQRITFLFDYALYELRPRGYHLTSVAVHALAACMLFLFAEKLLKTRAHAVWCALAIAVTWAIHPAHTSAVTYIAGRADPLAAAFGFAALLCGWISLDRAGRARFVFGSLAFVFFLAALLSKESGITALLIWFVLLIWRRVNRRLLFAWVAAAVGVVALYGLLRTSADKVAPPHSDIAQNGSRPALIARAAAEYAGLLLCPRTLRMERDVSTTANGTKSETVNKLGRHSQTVLGLLLIGAGVAWWMWGRRRDPLTACALAAFATAYLPISNLFPLNATVAEHWLYVPSAFFFLALFSSLHELRALAPRVVGLAMAVIVAAGVYYAQRTWRRQADWRDQRTFLTRTIQDGGDSARMRVNLGQLEFTERRFPEALKEFETALQYEPNLSFALLGMASVHIQLGAHERARALLERAARFSEVATEARQHIGALEFRQSGRDSTPLLREAAELAPTNWPAWKRYIRALDATGKTVLAIQETRRFLERQSFRADTWLTLGELLEKVGDRERAKVAYTEAARRDVWGRESRGGTERLGEGSKR